MKSLEFDPAAFDDLAWWIEKDRKIALRIMKLIEDVQRNPCKNSLSIKSPPQKNGGLSLILRRLPRGLGLLPVALPARQNNSTPSNLPQIRLGNIEFGGGFGAWIGRSHFYSQSSKPPPFSALRKWGRWEGVRPALRRLPRGLVLPPVAIPARQLFCQLNQRPRRHHIDRITFV